MSALGSQTTVDPCPVHHGIKSELLTRALQTFHGRLPLPAPSRNPLSLWLLCWPLTYSGLPRLCLYTLAQLQGPSHLSEQSQGTTPGGRHCLPRSHVCSAQHSPPGLPAFTTSLLRTSLSPTAHSLSPTFLVPPSPWDHFSALTLTISSSLDLGGWD